MAGSNRRRDSDLQCTWMRLLYCCAAQANYTLRIVHPGLTATFAAHHDASLRHCLSQPLGVDPRSVYWDVAMGLRSATATSRPAFWSSWADCWVMVQQRHPIVSVRIVHALNAHLPAFHQEGVRVSGAHLAAAGLLGSACGRHPTGADHDGSGQSTKGPSSWLAAHRHRSKRGQVSDHDVLSF